LILGGTRSIDNISSIYSRVKKEEEEEEIKIQAVLCIVFAFVVKRHLPRTTLPHRRNRVPFVVLASITRAIIA
jgi:hypothetical protein